MIPDLTPEGILSEGTYDCTFPEIETRFVHNDTRREIWRRFLDYLKWVRSLNFFTIMYVGGSFVTDTEMPTDVDVALDWQGNPPMAVDPKQIALAMEPGYTKSTYGVQAWPARKIPRMPDNILFVLRRMTDEEADRRGLPKETKKGLLRVLL